jgi:hypothetical protein
MTGLDTLEIAKCEEEFNAKLVSIALEVINIKDISFEFFNRFSSVDVDFNDSDSNTSYGTVGSAYYFAKCITERVDEYHNVLGYFITILVPLSTLLSATNPASTSINPALFFERNWCTFLEKGLMF